MRRIAVGVLCAGLALVGWGCSKSTPPLGGTVAPPVIQQPVPNVETGSDFIVLRWTQSSDPNFASYEVHELPDSTATPGSATLKAVVADRATAMYRVGNLTTLTRHYFKVRTVLSTGASAFSDVIAVNTTNGECLPPPAVVVRPIKNVSNSTVGLEWSAVCAANFSAYEIFVGTQPGFEASPANRKGVVQYCVDTSFTVQDLTQGTQYYFKVGVTNFCLKSSISNEMTVKTLTKTDTIPPVEPTIYNFERSDITGTSIRVRWQRDRDPADADWASYRLYRGFTDGFTATPEDVIFETTNIEDTSFTLEGLIPATPYYFVAVSKDSSGNDSRFQANAIGITSPPVDPFLTIGTFGRSTGQLREPSGAVLDNLGHVWVSNKSDNRVDRFSAPLAFFEDTSPNAAQDTMVDISVPVPGDTNSLLSPTGVAVDDSNNLYICDTGHHRIVRTSPSGQFQYSWGAVGYSDSLFQTPMGIVVDPSGIVWVVDRDLNKLVRFSKTGRYLGVFTKAFRDVLLQPTGVCYHPGENDLLVTDQGHHRVCRFDLTGTGVVGDLGLFNISGTDSGVFNQPTSTTVALDNSGQATIYVADTGNNRIQVFFRNGIRPLAMLTTNVPINQPENFLFNKVKVSRPLAVTGTSTRMFAVDTGHSRCVLANVSLAALVNRPSIARKGHRLALRPAPSRRR